MRLSILQKLNPSAIGNCAIVFVPRLAIWKRRNWGTFAHWSMQVRLFLRNLQTRGAFIVAFTSEKWKITTKKKLVLQFAIDTKFFHCEFANPCMMFNLRCSRSGVCMTAQLTIRCLLANYCTIWRCNFKGLSEDWGRLDFSKNPPRISL